MQALDQFGFLQAIEAPYNKSLDASGTSGLVIDILSATQLSPAASTQSFGRYRVADVAIDIPIS